MRELTVKQKAFAEYYMEYGNATKAYKLAGYKANTDLIAGVEGHKLLKLPKVNDYIGVLQQEVSSKRIANATEVLEYLTKVVRGTETEQMVVVQGIGDGCSQAKIVEKEISAKDKVKAAELLAKRYGLLTDKVDLNANMVVFQGEDKLED